MGREKKRLGEILMEDGLIADWQLEFALEEQKKTGEFLGDVLIKKGWIEEKQILKVLSEQFGVPIGVLELDSVDWKVAKHYPTLIAAESCCFPFMQDSSTLHVAISNPHDAWTISQIEAQARGRNVILCLVTKAEIRTAIEKFRSLL